MNQIGNTPYCCKRCGKPTSAEICTVCEMIAFNEASKGKFRWNVSYMKRGFEPPYPFGKTTETVFADSRLEAIEKVKATGRASSFYPIKASKAKL